MQFFTQCFSNLARTDLFQTCLGQELRKHSFLHSLQRVRSFPFISALTTMKVLIIFSANNPSQTGPSPVFCSSSLRVWRDHPGIIILLIRSRYDPTTSSIKSSWTLLWYGWLFSSWSRSSFGEEVVEVLVVHLLNESNCSRWWELVLVSGSWPFFVSMIVTTRHNTLAGQLFN